MASASFALGVEHADFGGRIVHDDLARLIAHTLQAHAAPPPGSVQAIVSAYAPPKPTPQPDIKTDAAPLAADEVTIPVSISPPPLSLYAFTDGVYSRGGSGGGGWRHAKWYTLSVAECWLSPDAGMSLAAALALNPPLAHFNLNSNESIGDPAISAIARAITNPHIMRAANDKLNAQSDAADADADADASDDDTAPGPMPEPPTVLIPADSSSAVAAASDELSFNTSLLTLSIAACGIRSIGIQSIALALAYNHSLTRLDISSNYVGEHSGVVLGAALTRHPTLCSLAINRCSLTSAAFAPLAAALAQNTVLTELYADGNMLDFVTGQNMNRALRVNRSLVSLSIDHNRLTDIGVLAIAEVLTAKPDAGGNRTLTGLSIQYNRTSSDSLSCFGAVLTSNRALRSLHLRHESASTAIICRALHDNRTLTELSFTQDIPTSTASDGVATSPTAAAVATAATATAVTATTAASEAEEEECLLSLVRMLRAPNCVSALRFVHLTHTSDAATRSLVEFLNRASTDRNGNSTARRLLYIRSSIGTLSAAPDGGPAVTTAAAATAADERRVLRRQLGILLASNKARFDACNRNWQRIALAAALFRARHQSNTPFQSKPAVAAATDAIAYRTLLHAVMAYV